MPAVLIVDDEPLNRQTLRHSFENKKPTPWTVFEADGPDTAQEIIAGGGIDVVVTDLVMGDPLAGIRLLEWVQQRYADIPVIILTAFAVKLQRYEAFAAGAFDCIDKGAPGVVARDEVLVKAAAAVRLRERVTEADRLRRYLDPYVYERLGSDPRLLDLQQRTVTIVFWDIRGFSRLSENLRATPTLVSGFLREYFDLAAEVVQRNGGVLDKFIGDGVMAIFGAFDDTDAAEVATVAACEFVSEGQQLVDRWTVEWVKSAPNKVDCGVGAGVHTGAPLVGNAGCALRDQFTALGADVNFAARLEGLAGKGQVVVSASTNARLTSDGFRTEELETVDDIKNIAGEFDLFAVEEWPSSLKPASPI